MTALALSPSLAWPSPIHLLHELTRRVADVLPRRQIDTRAQQVESRAQAIQSLLTTWQEDIQRELDEANISDIDALALSLGRRNLPYFQHLVPLSLELLEQLEEENSPAGKAIWQGWQAVGERAESILPRLSPPARRDVRAAAFILGDMLKSALPEGTLSRATIDTAVREALDTLDPDGPENDLRLYGLMQILGVLGMDPDYPDALGEAAALALWRLIREQAPEELVEDAFLSAEATEADLARDDEDTISLSAYLRARPG